MIATLSTTLLLTAALTGQIIGYGNGRDSFENAYRAASSLGVGEKKEFTGPEYDEARKAGYHIDGLGNIWKGNIFNIAHALEEREKLNVKNKEDLPRMRTLDWLLRCETKVRDKLHTPQMRTWVDNTGSHKVKAKLLEIKKMSVKLETEDGREIVVLKSKLSRNDKFYARGWEEYK